MVTSTSVFGLLARIWFQIDARAGNELELKQSLALTNANLEVPEAPGIRHNRVQTHYPQRKRTRFSSTKR